MNKENQIIICPGSINPDFVIKCDKSFVLANKTMTFHGESTVFAGGKGRNQAVAAKKASGKSISVILVGKVGDDALGTQAIKTLKKEKVITDYISKSKKKETGKAIISLFKGGYEIVGLDLGANTDLSILDVDKAKNEIAKSKILACQIENTKETTAYSLKLAKKHDCFTVLNPSIVPNDKTFLKKNVFPYVDLMVLNVQEAGQIVGKNLKSEKDVIYAGKKICSLNIKYVVLTRGESGSIVFHKSKQEFVKAFKVKVVDTVAVGDNFIGALIARIVDFIDNFDFELLVKGVKFATAAAALTVGKKGASESSPTRF
ncbi:MAG: bifunctional hydroxymethylpyrimidine kinase/phosphomethylpyrimidine kinase, partial [Nanoarchaeota archaeon]|nr:bifunctional hydroxymethylpyrimidine kinase/phosphomethylpyrimidine kinase [Nanoarchaeota archaeon]MBU1854503.1 bifunctional hydroxymethylpyrimidine kinase/phosphomethylpyrimidine kinase [Nanoarchaeota archaeon]